MKILNLYSGLGGNRKLWSSEHEVTAVEINKDVASAYKFLYPNDNVINCVHPILGLRIIEQLRRIIETLE